MTGRASSHAHLGSAGTQARDGSLQLAESPGGSHCLLLGANPALLPEQRLCLILPPAEHSVLGTQLCARVAGCRLQVSQQRIMLLLTWEKLHAGAEQPRKPWQAMAGLM